MKGMTTKAVHGALEKKDAHGSLRFPVYDNVAFEFEKAADMQKAFEGRKLAHAYSRISNPTVADFENRLRLVADAAGVIATSSGMAAISNVILAIAESGTNIVTTRFLFGNTYSLFENTLKAWGLDILYVDMADAPALEKAINDKTRAVFLETITNPQLQVADLGRITAIAHKKGVPVVVDSTMTTPWLLKTKETGVDIEVLSSTKYISGGATSIGGAILDNGLFPWSRNPKLAPWAEKFGPFALLNLLRREVARNIGACMAPHNAYLQTLGMETMGLRVKKSSENALALARFLDAHPKVSGVNYPGLGGSLSYDVARKQLRDGFGGILTFRLPSKSACFQLMDSLSLIRRATNLNDNKTLILHPASTIFCEYSGEEKEQMGVDDTLIRLSAGIEDLDDLLDDLKKGLETI